jgi:hypothetical protein
MFVSSSVSLDFKGRILRCGKVVDTDIVGDTSFVATGYVALPLIRHHLENLLQTFP